MNKSVRKLLVAGASFLMVASFGMSFNDIVSASSVPSLNYRFAHAHLSYSDPRTVAGDKYSLNYKGYRYTINALGRIVRRKPLHHMRYSVRYHYSYKFKKHLKRNRFRKHYRRHFNKHAKRHVRLRYHGRHIKIAKARRRYNYPVKLRSNGFEASMREDAALKAKDEGISYKRALRSEQASLKRNLMYWDAWAHHTY